MRACSMTSGGVFFIPDEIKRKDCGNSSKTSPSEKKVNLLNTPKNKTSDKSEKPSLQEAA